MEPCTGLLRNSCQVVAGNRARPRASWTSLALAVVSVTGLAAGSGYVMAPASTAGRAVDLYGRPVAGVAIVAGSDGRRLGAPTGPSGAFVLVGGSHLQPPPATLQAPGYLPAPLKPGLVTLHRRPLVQGRAVDATGAGVGFARLSVEMTGGATVEEMTDGAGFFGLDEGLLPGIALITVTAAGHDAYQSRLPLAADEVAQVDAQMPAAVAWIDVTTDPAGMPVLVDGAPAPGCGSTPCTASIDPGNHVVSIEQKDYVPWSVPIAAYEGSHLPLATALERKMGALAVSTPGGTDSVLVVDGQPVAASGWSAVVPTGGHTVSFTSADTWPWAQTVQVDWNQTTHVSVAPQAVGGGSLQAFQSSLTAYLDSLSGHYSVYVADVSGSRSVTYHPGDLMEAASVIKLPLAIYVEQQAQAKAIKMGDTVELADGDFEGGTGTLQSTNNPGDKISYHDLLALLVQQSDNTAWQALDRALSKDKVDAYAASIGAPDCHQSDDQCSAQEAGQLIARLASGSLLDSAHTQDLLGLLESTAFNDRINYYLGGRTIAHKVGMDGGVINDTGVVFGGQPFVVSVFTYGDDPSLGVEIIRLVSRAAAQLFS